MTDGSMALEQLHPALIHHLVNQLGWRSLRPLQAQAAEPLLAGEHALLGAPTAGGKTEAALLPLLTRMASEPWSGLSVLYVCPIRALLNNLLPRVSAYCEVLGRRAAIWHGDVGEGDRRRVLRDPPDVLLTTPESIEAMHLSRRVDAHGLLSSVRAVVVDEVHAFAGDDRGWHLIALLQRLAGESAYAIQRVGLSATVGNPTELLEWLCLGAAGERSVVSVPASDARPELVVDYVGSVPNAARVIASLHRGEKRLVFADSRARVEELGAALRAEGTTTFVSHSSLSADDRRQAERAFTEARDCVIVATSTLELGIDVGDLDRVIQLDAPRTVASVLQRMGRTGRRAGTARNCLFLTTKDDQLVQALAMVELISEGWVEPLVPPPEPVHLLAQQLLARVLADGRIGRSSWPGSLEAVVRASSFAPAVAARVLEHMVDRDVLLESSGTLQVGEVGERLFGRRHFMDVTSVFLTEPLLLARWGARELGQVDPTALLAKDGRSPVILLGGASWAVGDVDWNRRVVWVEPTDDPGRARWVGSGGALSIEVCHAMRSILAADTRPPAATNRAAHQLNVVRDEFAFVEDRATALERDADRDRTRWWTFAGGRANAELAARCAAAGHHVAGTDDLGLSVLGTPSVRELVEAARRPVTDRPIDPARLETIKFHEAVPEDDAAHMVRARDADSAGLARMLGEPVTAV